ncbi:hypothetical protein Tco_1465981 [Tanacetum coccineum]
MSTDKESSAAGTNNRPPMLVESDYESLKIRIKRYICGKPLGKLIWRSIQNESTPHPQITVTEGQGDAAVQVTRDKRDEEFTEIENNKELADIQATNIPSQGLSRHVFNILNQTRTGKEIWDNAKYVTNVKNNKDISVTTYVELYTYLKSYEPHAMKTLKKQEQSTSIVDPLAYLAQTTHYHAPTQTTTLLPPQYGPLTSSTPQQVPQSSNDAMLATMNQIVNLLSGFQKQFPPTNNQLRTSSNSRSHATVHDGQIITETVQRRAPGNVGNTGNRGTQNYGQMTDNVGKKVICYNCRGEGYVSRQCKEKKRVKDSQYFKDKMLLMEAKEKGTVLDAEAEAFLADVECTAPYDQPLAITTTNMFEVSHEDAYDSDVDEGPHAAAAFMANLSSTSGTNGATTSQVNEVHTDANQIFDNVNHLLTHEMHQEEHLDSDVESDIDDNTIPYHQYQLDSEVQDVPTEEQSLVNNSLRVELARYKQEMASLECNKVKHDLDQTIIQRNKRNAELEEENVLLKSKLSQNVESINSLKNESKKVVSEKKVLEDKYLEEIVYMRIFDELDTEYERCVLANKNLKIERKNLLIQNDCLIANSLEKDICSIVLASDIVVPPSSNCLCEELRSNCDREHSKVVELEAEILKKQQMLNESEKRCAFIEKNHVNLQVKFQKYKECLQNQRVCDNSNSTASNAIFEINKLKDQLQGKDDTIRNLQTQINITRMLNVGSTVGSFDKQALETELTQLKDALTSVRIQIDGYKAENVNLKRRYEELSKSNAYSRSTFTAKINALTAENAKLKTELSGKKSSGSTASEKPKVLASGMYTNSSKTKPATESRKPMPKSHTRNHRILPSKSVNARRAADHNRKLNVVDHNQFVIRSLKSVNTKTPQAKHSVNHTKKVWKATRNHNVNTTKTAWRLTGKVVDSVKPQWKPTGRNFGLYDNCPLTRIMEPIVEPLELTPSVSSSSKVTMISRFTDCKLSDRKAGSKGISGQLGRNVADSIAERLKRPTAYKFRQIAVIRRITPLLLVGAAVSRDLYPKLVRLTVLKIRLYEFDEELMSTVSYCMVSGSQCSDKQRGCSTPEQRLLDKEILNH